MIFGTDYVVREREAQARMLRDAVTRHVERFPESVLVVEEYDKLGCPARGMLKQMLEHGSAGGEGNPFDRNVTFARSIFVLEANMGFMDVHARVGRRTDVASAATPLWRCNANSKTGYSRNGQRTGVRTARTR